MKKSNAILPGQTIGIIGGGQLGRMMAIAARYMGYKIAVLDPTSHCPTAQVADYHIVAAYDDMEAIRELTEVSDVITYEFENVDLDAAAYIEEKGKLPQGARALEVTQNREEEKQIVSELSLEIPEYRIVHNEAEAKAALQEIGFPSVIKTYRGGYDGKGQLKLESDADSAAAATFAEEKKHCIIEQWVSFDKEISTVFTRSTNGDIEFFPIGENEHLDHILYKTTVPAKVTDNVKEKAVNAVRKIADKMDIVGTFAIEMFVRGDDVYVNEMAPRPHNSGHYTIEACNISQFEQHIRAICNLPLIPVHLHMPSVMINILGEDVERTKEKMQHTTDGFVHLYGKAEPKQKRKMGHITFIAENEQLIQQQIEAFEEAAK